MKKLQRIFFWLLVFLLPCQLGKHFWPQFSYVLGLRVDYLSPTIYLTDILVLTILVLWGWQKRKKITGNFKLLILLLFLALNLFLSENRPAAFFKLLKISELVFLGLYVAKIRIKLADFSLPLSLAIVYSSLIALGQFFKQSTLGGIFYWLGERSFNVTTPGIAKTSFQGQLLMRPYATFPHPNVLAGFILVSLVLLFSARGGLRWLTLALGLAAIILSFSRSAWLGSALAVLSLSFPQPAVAGFFFFNQSFWQEKFFWQRIELNRVALQMIKTKPWLGVGFNNFISQLPHFWPKPSFTYWLQPVHNIFLLVAAEAGLIGFLIFGYFLFLTFKRLISGRKRSLLVALSVILFTGLFDHYWLTLQQTQLLLAIVLGLCWTKKFKLV